MMTEKFKTRGLRKEALCATTNDEVHGSIKLCPLIKELLNTPQVQRLRQLKQLGTSTFTYINTTHTRFEHSLGVMSFAGVYLSAIAERQPRLGITQKDIMCVKIAGLLHDIGHGPYSHVFDGVFRKQLKHAEEKGSWLGQPITKYKDMPEPIDGWAHEDGSLMMIDAMLAYLGLEIDESNLDEPLKQIGNGIDAKRFGIWDRMSEQEVPCDADSDDESVADYDGDDDDDNATILPNDLVLTSRDWIFIKECIAGGPLPPNGLSIANFSKSNNDAELIGRPLNKEFLYDVVSNRHSGMDVDKMDYLARDTMRAHGSNCIGDLMNKLTEKLFVAWGECPHPSTCFKCKLKKTLDSGDDKTAGMHLMICYPDSLAPNCMSFFEQRYKEHQRLYTHTKTARTNYMMCDILLLAEPYFRIISMNDDDDITTSAAGVKLPISRAMTSAETYLELTDSVIDKIMNTEDVALRPARQLIKRLRMHGKYAKCGRDIITDEAAWSQKLWGMTEPDIVNKILEQSDMSMSDLGADDIIVDKNTIHHGAKEKNPVDSMRFLSKKYHRQLLNGPEKLPVAKQIPGMLYRKPDIFIQKSVRIFCRSPDPKKHRQLARYYKDFTDCLKNEVSTLTDIQSMFEAVDGSEVANSLPAVSQSPVKYEDDYAPPCNKRPKYDKTQSLFSNVKRNIDNN